MGPIWNHMLSYCSIPQYHAMHVQSIIWLHLWTLESIAAGAPGHLICEIQDTPETPTRCHRYP